LEGKITIGAGGDKANARAGEAGARLFLSCEGRQADRPSNGHPTFSRGTPL
jgi:hypothetical protein